MSEEAQQEAVAEPAAEVTQSDAQLLEKMMAESQTLSTQERLFGKQETVVKQEPEAPAEATQDSADVDKAKQVLQRAKISKDIISGLTDEQILEQASTLAESQAEQDRAGNWRDELMKRIEALESGDSSEEGSDDSEEGDEPVAQPSKVQDANMPDLSEALQPIDEYLYEGIPEAMQNVVGKMVEFNELRMQEVFDQQLAIHNDMMQFVARRELRGDYPELQDPVAWQKVSATMEEIAPILKHDANTSPFERYINTVQRAAQEVLGFDKGSNSAPEAPSQLPVPNRKASDSAPMSNDERARAYLAARFDTGSDSAARRAAGLF